MRCVALNNKSEWFMFFDSRLYKQLHIFSSQYWGKLTASGVHIMQIIIFSLLTAISSNQK